MGWSTINVTGWLGLSLQLNLQISLSSCGIEVAGMFFWIWRKVISIWSFFGGGCVLVLLLKIGEQLSMCWMKKLWAMCRIWTLIFVSGCVLCPPSPLLSHFGDPRPTPTHSNVLSLVVLVFSCKYPEFVSFYILYPCHHRFWGCVKHATMGTYCNRSQHTARNVLPNPFMLLLSVLVPLICFNLYTVWKNIIK